MLPANGGGSNRLEWMVKSGDIYVVLAGLRDNTIRFPWPDPA
jgi:RNA polymerase-associated protein